MKYRRFIVLALAGLFVAGCGANEAVGEQAHLIIAQDGEPVVLDPHRSNDPRSATVINQIFERLINQDEDGNLHPSLATDWRQIDELTYEFDIRPGVYFHNGEALHAEDVVFSLIRAATSPTSATFLGMLNPDAIYAVADLTIRVGTDIPFVPLTAQLAHTAGNIVPRQAALELGEDFGSQPIGTGGFKLEEWRHGEQVELVRFEDFHGERSALDRITFRNIPDAANRIIELETGAAHIAMNIAPSQVASLEARSDLTLLREESLRSHYIGFNVQQAPFNDVRVRQAINYAVDVDLIIDTILEGVGVRAFGPLSSQVWGAHPNLPAYGFDIEHARQLLADAGLADGFSTRILTDQDNNNRNIAEVLQNKLQELSITSTVESVEWPTFLETVNEGQHEIFITGWTVGTMDADYGLFPLFHTDSRGAGGNRAFYSNPEVDRLL
ncbi:MAG: ABC transporter substrate-binding protein, partial [Turicibacter sp.]|nr:ABC transporter substrate-binding protein [Turicibacter sp.]